MEGKYPDQLELRPETTSQETLHRTIRDREPLLSLLIQNDIYRWHATCWEASRRRLVRRPIAQVWQRPRDNGEDPTVNKKKPAGESGQMPKGGVEKLKGREFAETNYHASRLATRPDPAGSVANRKIYRAASLMVRHHGMDALTRAVERLEELRAPGHEDEQAVWLRMVVAIARLLDHEKPDDASIH